MTSLPFLPAWCLVGGRIKRGRLRIDIFVGEDAD